MLGEVAGVFNVMEVGAAGAVVSMIIALFEPNEFAAPGVASVKVALFPAASLMVPEFKASDVVAT